MSAFVTVLVIFVGILLGLIVLIQNPKGGGLASGFSGANQFGGVQRTSDFLDKATWVLVISLLVLSVWSSSISHSGVIEEEQTTSGIQEMVEEEPGQQPIGPIPTQESPTQGE